MSRLGRVSGLVALAVLSVAPVFGAAVTVGAKVEGIPTIGGTVKVTAVVTITDHSKLTALTLSQKSGPAASWVSAGKNAFKVTMAQLPPYREALGVALSEPPGNLVDEDEYTNGIQDRWQIVGLNHYVRGEAGAATFEFVATTTSGTYKGPFSLNVDLPYRVSTGLQNLQILQPVLLYGKEQSGYDWVISQKPAGSAAALTYGTSRMPAFTPDVPGIYKVTVTDKVSGASPAPVTLTIYAGTWRGVIVGQDSHGLPIADSACTNCHNVPETSAKSFTGAPDMFTPWRKTGHAAIFTDNINTSTHYGEACLECHTVGYDLMAMSKGIDESSDWQAFMKSGMLHEANASNWTVMLSTYPKSAQKANIQCENCHGPQVVANDTSPAHGLTNIDPSPRVSVAAEICGSCHGEPQRHGRYQQWQLSGHANFETAVGEGTNSSCAKCHSAQGYIQWVPVIQAGDATAIKNFTPPVMPNADNVQPQTCVVCHDPHAVGTSTDKATDAKMRIYGSTPIMEAGFSAKGVGNGAVCITCHNSRRGLRNDATFASLTDKDRATHVGPQSDVLFGQNAFFVTVGVRGRHSLLQDACVTCHMEKSPPPASLAYRDPATGVLGGTNHTFSASPQVCEQCHVGVDLDNLETGFEAEMDSLKHGIINKTTAVLQAQLDAGYKISVDPDGTGTNGPIPPTVFDKTATFQITNAMDLHGRQAIDITVNGVRLTNTTPNPPEYGVQMGNVKVIQGSTTKALYDVSGDQLPKAFWNYLLLEADMSKGAHNPTWVLNVLHESRSQIGAPDVKSRGLRASDLAVGLK